LFVSIHLKNQLITSTDNHIRIQSNTKFIICFGATSFDTKSPVLLIIYSLFFKVAFLYAGLSDIQLLTLLEHRLFTITPD